MHRCHVEQFESSCRMTEAGNAAVSTTGAHGLPVMPAQRRGHTHGSWSPETLLLAAVESQLMFRFLRQARERGLAVESYESEGIARELEDGQDPGKLLDITITPRVLVPHPDDVERARELLAELSQQSTLAGLPGPRVHPFVRCVQPSHALRNAGGAS